MFRDKAEDAGICAYFKDDIKSKKISKNIIKPIDKIGKVCYNTIIAYQSGRINKIRGNHYEQEL